MTLFKNFKCPNGLPPDECLHLQQLVINLSNYLIRRQELREASARDAKPDNIQQSQQPATSNGQRERTRR